MKNNQIEQLKQKSLLSSREKMSFFAVNFGNIPIMTLMNAHLLYFYVVVIKLDPIAIGTLFLISRVFDGINDPFMGYIVDRLPPTKLGRFRTYLIIGVVICSINYALLWLGPSMVTFGQLAIAFVSYILFGFTFDLMDIPLNSMIPVMSDVDNDRNILSNIKGLAYMTGGILFTAIPVFLMNIFSTKIQAFQILILLTLSTVLVFSILGTLGIKEKVKPIEEKKYSIREIIDILGAKPVYILFVEGLFKSIGGGLQMAIMLIFFESVLGNGDLFISIGLTTTIGILIGIVIGPKMIKRYSKKTTRIIAGIFSVLSLTLSFFIPRDQPSLFLLVAFIFAPGGGVNSLLDYGIQADNMDYVEWKLGYRAEGVIASLNSFIVKSAGGIGASIAAYMLFIFRYDQTEGAIQSSFTITGLYIANFGIPAIFTLVGVLIWAFGYPLNRKMRNQMMEELSERRNVQGINSS